MLSIPMDKHWRISGPILIDHGPMLSNIYFNCTHILTVFYIVQFFVVQCCSASRTRPCAVMVWIHGGGFAMLDGSPMTFGPNRLMDNDIILV